MQPPLIQYQSQPRPFASHIRTSGVGVLGGLSMILRKHSSAPAPALPHVAGPPRFGDFPTEKKGDRHADDIRLRKEPESMVAGMPICKVALPPCSQTTTYFVQRSTWVTRFVGYSGRKLIYLLHRGCLSSSPIPGAPCMRSFDNPSQRPGACVPVC
ncbi:hypothetical protein PG987_011898 [Apiospora arundinis]